MATPAKNKEQEAARMLQIYDSVSSTMDTARQWIETGRVTFDSRQWQPVQGILAYEQTAGRGQRGRVWHDTRGASLCVTYFYPGRWVDRARMGQIAFVAGVAVAQTMERLIQASEGECKPQVGLKWPNDVLLSGRKAGGILIETAPGENLGEHVGLVGVGINLGRSSVPVELQERATSLLQEGVSDLPVEQLGEAIAEELTAQAEALERLGFSEILQRWRRWDNTPGRTFATEVDGQRVIGTALGVDAQGALRLRLNDGQEIAALTASTLHEIG